MAAKQHDFHILEPSKWPAIAAFSLFVLPIGALMFIHEKPFGGAVMAIGFLMVFYVMFGWWRDVTREGAHHTSAVQMGLRLGMALFILSEVMFFFAFFFSYFKAAIEPVGLLDGVWVVAEGIFPPKGVVTFDPWDIPLLNTLILLLSGTTVTWAHYALLQNNRQDVIRGLTATVALGVTFTALQAYEYGHAVFGFKDGIYSTNFYMATGFHGFHVIIGTIFLAVCLVRAGKGELTEKNHLGFEFAAWYWHFVDVVWLFLFTFVYVWGQG
jgi:cytochrome c oxidase subunit 3